MVMPYESCDNAVLVLLQLNNLVVDWLTVPLILQLLNGQQGEGDIAETPAELLYRAMLPSLPQYMVSFVSCCS